MGDDWLCVRSKIAVHTSVLEFTHFIPAPAALLWRAEGGMIHHDHKGRLWGERFGSLCKDGFNLFDILDRHETGRSVHGFGWNDAREALCIAYEQMESLIVFALHFCMSDEVWCGVYAVQFNVLRACSEET